MYGAFLASAAGNRSVSSLLTMPGKAQLMGWCQEMGPGTAILLVLVGVVYLLYGWTLFKWLVTLNAALLAGYVGMMLGQRAGGYMVAGAFIGAAAGAAVAWPLMRWAVAVIGGLVGACVGSTVWMVLGQDPSFAWSGALTGLVAFALFTFILFRGSVIVYTSLQGALMLIMGLLGLAMKWPESAASVNSLCAHELVLPVSVLVAAVAGATYQQTHSGGGEEK